MRKRVFVFNEKPEEKETTIEVKLPPMRLNGYLWVDVIDAKTGEIKQSYEGPNLITHIGMWNALSGSLEFPEYRNYYALGSGSTFTESVTDTTMSHEYARSNDDGGFSDISGYVDGVTVEEFAYWYVQKTRIFTEGSFTGSFSEFGTFVNSSGGDIFIHSIMKDPLGPAPPNPGYAVTMSKTAGDIVRVKHEIRNYVGPVHSGSFLMAFSDIEHAYTASPVDVTSATTWGDTDQGVLLGGWFISFGQKTNMTFEAYASQSATFDSWSSEGFKTGSALLAGFSQSVPADTWSVIYPPVTGAVHAQTYEAIWQPSSANHGPLNGTFGGIPAFNFVPWGAFSPDGYIIDVNPSIEKTEIRKLTMWFTLNFITDVTESLTST